MRPTGRAVIVFALGIPFSLALIFIDQRFWPFGFAYLAIAVILTGTDALRGLPPRRLGFEVTPPAQLFTGDGDALQVTLAVPPGWPVATAELICDTGPEVAPPPPQTIILTPAGKVELAVPLLPRRRGIVDIHRLWLRWPCPLGLVRRRHIHPIGAKIPVVPNIRAVRQAAIKFSSRDALFGLKPEHQQGEGTEFECLRDYVPGLDHRSIDWKHSARHRKLVCKEFRAERNHQIILAFDTGHLMNEPLDGIPKLDHAINAGLLLGYMSLRGGDRIGMYAFDSQPRFSMNPVGGMQQFARLQTASAELAYQPEETNFTLGLVALLSKLNRRSLIILQTEFVDTITAELMVENIGRLAARHLVIFVTLQDGDLRATAGAPPDTIGAMAKAVIADDIMRERLLVFERLRRLGVHCLQAPSHRLGVNLINRYLAIKRKELI